MSLPGAAAHAVDRLLARPQGFDLFQAISLLERAAPDAVTVGRSHGHAGREAVRLRGVVSLGFEASDVREVAHGALTGESFTLHTPTLSLAGAGGPLPLPFTELLLERQARRDHATAEFLDIFNHRLLSFLYRSRRKHHVALSPRAPAQSALASTLDAASALGLQAGVRAPDGSAQWLRHAGLLGGAPRGMTGLLAILRERLGAEVHGTQFRGGWRTLEADALSRLGGRGVAPAPRLGQAAALGRRVWDQGAGVRLSFGNLTHPRLRALLPGGADHALARWLVRRYVPQDLDVEVELRLAPSQPRTSVLGAANPMRLGWTSWLASPMHRGPLPAVQLKLAGHGAAAGA